jgi:alpha-mannosidase
MSADMQNEKHEKKEGRGFNQVYFVNHSHFDISWGGTPRECLERNLEIIDNVLKAFEENTGFCFSMENVYPLIEYVKRYSERVNRIDELVKSGRLEIGGTFINPTVDYCFDECITRNIYLGKSWLKRTFDYDTRLAYEEDTSGHALQMPQLLKKSGIRYYKISRGPQSIFYWASPDGSSVLTYLAEYTWSYHSLLGYSSEETINRLPAELEKAKKNYRISNLMIPDGDHWSQPNLGLLEIVKNWNEKMGTPILKLGTTQEFMTSIENEREIPILAGDIPNQWIGIAAIEAEIVRRLRRIQNVIFSAEEFTAISSLIGGEHNFKDLQEAWRLILLTSDHNWGGKDLTASGEFCDEEKLRYLKQAAALCMKQLEKALENISSKVDTTSSNSNEIPIVVFNQLPWERSDIVELEIDNEAEPNKTQIRSHDGTYIPSQASVTVDEGGKRKIHLSFVAEAIPATGYKTYFITMNGSSQEVESLLGAEKNVLENRFFRIEVDPEGRGIIGFIDKERGVEIGGEKECSLGPMKFKFILNELFGLGLKMSTKAIPTVLDRTDEFITTTSTGEVFRAGDNPSTVSIIEDGPVKATILIEGKFIDSVKRQEITIYDKLNRVDLRTTIEWSGKNFVAIMLMFPLNLENATNVVINVPYGAVDSTDIARGFWIKPTDPAQFKLRGVQHWIDITDSGGGATLLTNWPCFDFTMAPAAVILWSMDNEHSFFYGTRYRQKGTHSLNFSLIPHVGGWRMSQAYRHGSDIAFPLIPVLTSQHTAFLPREISFIGIKGSNIVLTAMKKADDEKGFILRVYEAEGKERSFTVEFYREIKELWETNLLEENTKTLTFYRKSAELTALPYEIKTIRVIFKEI